MSRFLRQIFRPFLLITAFVAGGDGFVGSKMISQNGLASYYSERFHGRKTASGERFNMYDMTAAHRTLPFNTMLKVTNLNNNKSVIVRVNDRGPFGNPKRILDVSKAAAGRLDMFKEGIIRILMEQISKDELDNDKPDSPIAIFKNPTKPSESAERPSPPIPSNWVTGNSYSIWGTLQYPKGFGLQVSAYADAENAREDGKSLIDKNIKNVYIQVGWARNARIYRVVVGQYDDRDKALKALKPIQSAGFYAFPKKHFE